MLLEISVQNLALIEDVHVQLRDGFCAWTGETGAGKSLLLTALGLVLGQKSAPEMVRNEKTEARAAAVFEIRGAALKQDIEALLGGPIEEDQVILTRRVTPQGRSSAYVNGLPVPVSTLKHIGAKLLDVHGQTETRALADPEQQRTWLDAYGGLTPIVQQYVAKRQAYETIRKRREELLAAAALRKHEREQLGYEADELAELEPGPNEYEEMERDARRLSQVRQIRTAVHEGYQSLYESDRSAQELVDRVARAIRPVSDAVPELGLMVTDLERIGEEIRDLAYQLRQQGRDAQDDPDRLEDLESRMARFRRLAMRLHCAPQELATRRQEILRRLQALDHEETDLAGLDGVRDKAWSELRTSAKELTAARRKVVKAFSREVQGHLRALALGDARISVELEVLDLGAEPSDSAPPEFGVDKVEIVFAPNPGEPPRPLRKIASGGELARVTLAIKTVLAEVDRVPTLIFDEIDTGVGGRLGAVLGRKMAELARHHQVICVTHLPQLASFAQNQWLIRKATRQGRTQTTITALGESERIEELAAMMRGDAVAEGTRQEIRAMLAEAAALHHPVADPEPSSSSPSPPLTIGSTPSHLIQPHLN